MVGGGSGDLLGIVVVTIKASVNQGPIKTENNVEANAAKSHYCRSR
jgi:hypothetical protein